MVRTDIYGVTGQLFGDEDNWTDDDDIVAETDEDVGDYVDTSFIPYKDLEGVPIELLEYGPDEFDKAGFYDEFGEDPDAGNELTDEELVANQARIKALEDKKQAQVEKDDTVSEKDETKEAEEAEEAEADTNESLKTEEEETEKEDSSTKDTFEEPASTIDLGGFASFFLNNDNFTEESESEEESTDVDAYTEEVDFPEDVTVEPISETGTDIEYSPNEEETDTTVSDVDIEEDIVADSEELETEHVEAAEEFPKEVFGEETEEFPKEVFGGEPTYTVIDTEPEQPTTKKSKKKRMSDDELTLSTFLPSMNPENLVREYKMIPLQDIRVTKTMMSERQATRYGLRKSISDESVLVPIHVMPTVAFGKWIDAGNDPDEFESNDRYLLIDGYRRVYSAMQTDTYDVPAVVWNFKDREYGERYILTLGVYLNRTAPKNMQEVAKTIDHLKGNGITKNRQLDWLLGLDHGDSAKIEDIMTCGFDDIIEPFIEGKKTLAQSESALKKKRAAENKYLEEDNLGLADLPDSDNVVAQDSDEEGTGKKKGKTREEVDELMGIVEPSEAEAAKEEMLEPQKPHVQDVKHREKLDKNLRAEVLRRDGYKCVCCGAGEGLPINFALTLLQAHHKVSVANHGPDTLDNLVTVCPNCHTLIHTLLFNKGQFDREDLAKLPPDEQKKMHKVIEIASVDFAANKKAGKTGADLVKDNANHNMFKMPGVDQRENLAALKANGDDLAEIEKEREKAQSKVKEESEAED